MHPSDIHAFLLIIKDILELNGLSPPGYLKSYSLAFMSDEILHKTRHDRLFPDNK